MARCEAQALMMMRRWHFYDAETGVFTGRSYSTAAPDRVLLDENGAPDGTEPPLEVEDNTPPGCLPWAGDVDWRAQRVVDGELVDYQPPAPADDAMQTWAWDAAAKRWVASPTLAAIKRDRRQAMADAWNTAREAGVTVGGKVAPTDAASWTRYLAIKAMQGDGAWVDVPIPLADGKFELLTAAKAGALWTALKSMERALLAQLRDRVEAINAAATPAEVEEVTW